MTRRFLALLVTIALPALAAAQSRPAVRTDFPAMMPIGVGLPSIVSPLTPIGLPLSPFGTRPETDKTFLNRGRLPQRQFPGQFNRHPHAFQQSAAVVFFVPYFADIFAPVQYSMPGYVASAPAPVTPPPPSPPPVPAPATGVLRLELEGAGRGTQVYVDGYFVGTLDDLGGQLILETGPHRVEIRATGFETLVFDVKVDRDRPITYRGTLIPLAVAPVVQSDSKPPSTIYFIPGCYLGNVPPSQASLPSTCDISQLSTYKS